MSADKNRPIFSRFWTCVAPRMDEGGVRERRRELLAGLSGHVLEVGAGSGLNFPWYPQSVASVVAVEPERHLRRKAQAAAKAAPVNITVMPGAAERLDVADATVDAVVFSLVLCSVRDQARALREARRVLRPGGQLRFLEHVRASNRWLGRAQDLLDATVYPLLSGGCHMGRDTATALRHAGFQIDHMTRFAWPPGMPVPTSQHIIGTAISI